MVPLTTLPTWSPSRNFMVPAPVLLDSDGSMTASHLPFSKRIQLLSGFGLHSLTGGSLDGISWSFHFSQPPLVMVTFSPALSTPLKNAPSTVMRTARSAAVL